VLQPLRMLTEVAYAKVFWTQIAGQSFINPPTLARLPAMRSARFLTPIQGVVPPARRRAPMTPTEETLMLPRRR
jgi:hypothetical protein